VIKGARVALAGGLALLALALVLTLSGSPATVAPTHPIAINAQLADTEHSTSVCQSGETVPQDTSALRFSLKALIGPRVKVKVYAARHLATSGERAPGWSAGDVTVPVARVARTILHATVCLAFALTNESVEMAGGRTPRNRAAVTGDGRALPGRIKVEYMQPGHRSWWSLARSVARHLGLGRAWAGTWVALLALALMVTVLTLTAWSLLRLGLVARGRLPTAALACALVAFLNALAWSIVTPPFQVTDEADHFAYVQQLAERGLPPTSGDEHYGEAENVALTDLNAFSVRLQPENHPIFGLAEQRTLESDLQAVQRVPQKPTNGAGQATGEPPLYYALEAIPYTLVGGTVLQRLVFMRLLSALLAGITALFAFLFVREALPGVAWAWTVGALSVALAPLLGFMSGSVNPDTLLFAAAAALFYNLARAFRRGLTPPRALAIGTVAGIGLVTKLNFIGLVPGVLLGLAVLTLRARGQSSRPRTAVSLLLAVALAAMAVPVVAVVIVDALAHRAWLGPALGPSTSSIGHHGTFLGEFAYIWESYLPRLPGMPHDFHNGFAPEEIWFKGYVGLYGWLDTTFPTWVYTAALLPATLLAALCLRTLIHTRATFRRRLPELAVYTAITIGLLLMLGVRSYSEFPEYGDAYGEARYLLPLIPLIAAALTLAARAGGRRWGPIIGVLIVVFAFGHDIFSQLQVVARYYY
jgi:4-amino-4-deoxy-L-arabinose transferase-like glycosyltransferase